VAVLVGGARPLQVLTGKGVFMDTPDLMYVRELLASTEALCKEVAARRAEARRLQAQARALHSFDPWSRRFHLSKATAPPPLTG
jgi:hypothetical protein